MTFTVLRKAASELNVAKRGGHRVIVANRNRIKLMVVAASTSDRHPHHRSADRLHDFIHAISTSLSFGGLFATNGCRGNMRTGDKKSRRLTHSHRIASDLLFDEQIVRLVIVEGLRHVVSIKPSILTVHIAFRAVRFGPANHIQPVLRPAFTKVGRSEQAIHKFFVSLIRILRVIRLKLSNLIRRRRQTRQHNRSAANQRPSISLIRRSDAFVF